MSVVTLRGLGDGAPLQFATQTAATIRIPTEQIIPRSGGSSSGGAGGAGLSPALMRRMMDTPLAAFAITQQPAGNGGVQTGPEVETCACMVQKMAEGVAEQTGVMIPTSTIAQLNAMCVMNADALRDAASAAGINLDPCKPWYMRKTTWIAGGVLAAVGVGAFMVLR